jgi:uncharacterized RDD family membrane protein YckC
MSSDDSLPPAGWYLDPNSDKMNSKERLERFWNGSEWTEEVRNNQRNVFMETGEYYAGWWTRVGATIVDGIILLPLYFIFAGGLALFLFIAFYGQELSEILANNGSDLFVSDSRLTIISFSVVITIALISFLYQVLLIGYWGRTVGDRVAGIRIASQNSGGKASWSEASKRTLILTAFYLGFSLPFVGLFVSLLSLLNYFSMLWDSQRRCWHDIVGGTVVVKVKDM